MSVSLAVVRPTEDVMGRLYSPRQVAEMLTLSVERVRALVRDGHLRAIRVSARRLAIPEESLRAYMDRMMNDATDAA